MKLLLLLSFLLLPIATHAAPEYTGWLDGATCEQGISGWVTIIGQPETKVNVNINIDGKRSSTVVASKSRPDLIPYGFGALHGFVVPVPASRFDGKQHTITATVTGTAVALRTASPKIITCGGTPAPAPTGTPCPPCPCASPSPTATATPVATATPTATAPPLGFGLRLFWDAPDDQPGVTGWVVSYGTASGVLPERVLVNDPKPETLLDLPDDGRKRFFTVRACNLINMESEPSAELAYQQPSK